MTEIQLFSNGEFELRVREEGDSFIVEAPGLARALGMRDAFRLVESLPDDEKGYTTACTPGGDQEIWHVTESGFYRAIGQRQPKRIKSAEVRDQVIRFQNWVYRDVLPAIRRTGRYELPDSRPELGEDPFKPDAFTWKETCTVIRQEYRVRVGVVDLRRTLMAAGVLNQQFEPKAAFSDCFWWTGSAYLVFRHCVPALWFHYRETKRKLRAVLGPENREIAAGHRQGDLFAIEGGAS
ncbi:BRO-N domain-containing protein [Nonomuraea typhae]|uniref:BRO-N domain-containing protein n=1 Tax=Nonomuraea typhae TaxID=2603600 RepID=UPI0012FC2E62|nr:BRO family protein [Nonomuraea typhae]